MADLSMLDDRVLWTRATEARCEDAFRALMTRHEDLVWNVCSRMLRNSSDAEDAFQMAFIAMLEHGGDIRSADFRPWLYRVAYRAALRVQSAGVGVDSLSDLKAVPEDSVDTEVFRSIERAEQSQLIDEALDSLPENYREVLVLHYCCGVTRDDIASHLGLTPQTVKARLSRARKALRSRLLRRGLSLAFAAGLLGLSAEASVSDRLRDSTAQLAERWLTGEPVGLDLAQFSDFPHTEYGMKAFGGVNAKWTLVGAAALLALFLVFEAGRASGASTLPGSSEGVDRLPTTGTRIAFEDKQETEGIVPASHLVVKPSFHDAAQNAAAPASQSTAPQTQPVPGRTSAFAPTVANPTAAAQVAQPNRGLPDGTWSRDSMFGSVSFLVDGDRLQVEFQGKGELAMIRGSLLGEYAVASDGTVFGLFHGVDIDVPAEIGAEGAAELGPLMGMLSDSPFAMRVHTTGNTMVVKRFTLGISFPMVDGADEVAGMGAMAGMYVTGAYRSDPQPQRNGQVPRRVSVSPPLPGRMQPLTYPQGGPMAAPITTVPDVAGPTYYAPNGAAPVGQPIPPQAGPPTSPGPSPR